jgi:hypothetical protein
MNDENLSLRLVNVYRKSLMVTGGTYMDCLDAPNCQMNDAYKQVEQAEVRAECGICTRDNGPSENAEVLAVRGTEFRVTHFCVAINFLSGCSRR